MPWYKQWWFLSLVIALVMDAVVAGIFLIPSNFVRVLLLIGSIIYFIALALNPTFRYWRLAVFVTNAWLAVRIVPQVMVAAKWNTGHLLFYFTNEVGAIYDVAFAVVVFMLLLLDFWSRNPSPPSKWLGANLQIGIGSSQQLAGPQSNQSQIGNVYGDGVSISVNQGITDERVLGLLEQVQNKLDLPLESASDFNAEIDVARDYTEAGQPDISIEFLQKLQERYWDKLSVREKFRVLANLGHGYEAKGDVQKALRFFVDAKSHQPDDQLARSLEAAGYFSVGNSAKAHELSTAILQDFPSCEIAKAVHIRTSPSGLSLNELEASVPEALIASVEVLHALGWLAADLEEFDRAEDFARQALASRSDSPEIKEQIAAIIVQREARSLRENISAEGIAATQDRLNEAIDFLREVLRDRASFGPSRLSKIRYVRGAAYELLGDLGKAEADYSVASELAPEDPDIAKKYAVFLDQQGRADTAISLLKRAADSELPSANCALLSTMLAERNKEDDRKEAVRILTAAVKRLEEASLALRCQLVYTLVQIYGSEDRHDLAFDVLDNLPAQVLSEPFRLATEADALRRKGDIVAARAKARDASAASGPNLQDYEQLAVAQALTWLDLHKDALVHWRQIVPPTRATPEAKTALECARKCNDPRFIVDFCRELRHNGVHDGYCVELEVATLAEHNEFNEAVDAIQEYLSKPDDEDLAKILRARLSLIGKQIDSPELIEYDLSRLPDVSSVHPLLGRAVAQILGEGESPMDGVRYAYELVRHNFSSPDAHMALFQVIGLGEDTIVEIPEPGTVEIGAAVKFREDDSGSEHWRIIEDGEDPDINRDELDPGGTLAKELLSKVTGNQFYLRRDKLQSRMGTILLITSKYQYRKLDSFDKWEDRFPEIDFVKKYDLGKTDSGGPDPALIFRSLDQQAEWVEHVHKVYREHSLSVTSFAKLTGVSVIASASHLGSDEQLPIRCCRGSTEEYLAANSALEIEQSLVLCPSAVATLFLTDAYKSISAFPVECILPNSIMVEIRAELLGRYSRANARRNISKEGERYSYFEQSQEKIKDQQAVFEGFIKWLKAVSVPRGGLALADLPSERRKQLVKWFGEATAESIAIAAADTNIVLWTDDLAVAEIAITEFQVVRIWTHVYFEHLAHRDCVSVDVLTDLTIAQANLGYAYTRLTPVAAAKAASQSHWEPNRRPLSQILRWFANSGVTPEGLLGVLAGFLASVWRNAPLVEHREDVTRAVVKQVLNRADGRELMEQLLRHINQVFTIDVTNADRCAEIIGQVLSASNHGLILPGDPDFK